MLGGAACATNDGGDAAAEFSAPVDAGLMPEPANHEASGLAPSRRSDGVFWVLADSGAPPVLHAIDTAGAVRGRVRIMGVVNEDWEDLASYELDGKAWLVVADTGDNFANRPTSVLHGIREPDPRSLSPENILEVQPAFSVHFRFPSGPSDCEAAAVDPKERRIYLISKRDRPPRLYSLPLRQAAPDEPAVARLEGEVGGLAQRNGLWSTLLSPLFAYLDMPCALDFSPDGRLALVVTYGGTLLYGRGEGESWAAALGRSPHPLANHDLPQAEGGCFTRDGNAVFVCSEATARWLRYDRRRALHGAGR